MNRVKYYRAHIIRGKAAKELENLLPAYTSVIEDVTPSEEENFATLFKNSMRKILERYTPSVTDKTLDNHRTEIAGKWFALYYSENGVMKISERARKFAQDEDSAQFFKDLCYKSQFPNATVKKNTYVEWKEKGLSIRYYCYLTRFLQLAETKNIYLDYRQIGYYVLNNEYALTRKYSPDEILEQVVYDDRHGGIREVCVPKGENASYYHQHLREMCNLFVLSGIVEMDEDGIIRLNRAEEAAIKLFASHWNDRPLYKAEDYDFSKQEQCTLYERAWQKYFAEPSSEFAFFKSAIIIPDMMKDDELPGKPEEKSDTQKKVRNSAGKIGELGEYIVYQLERKRVSQNPRFKNDVRRIKNLGASTGYGYDIVSVAANIECERPLEPKDSIYIEVKTTRRVLPPDKKACVPFKFTRNEYNAARQHKDHFFIYKVVLFGYGGCRVYRIQNPVDNSKVEFEAQNYDVYVDTSDFEYSEYSKEKVDEL